MKCFSFFLFSIFAFAYAQGQDLVYTHDGNGNRIVRQQIVLKTAVNTSSTTVNNALDSASSVQTSFKENVIQIFPNPVANMLYLQVKHLPKEEPMQITITSAEGKVLRQQNVSTQATEIDMSGYASGIYVLRLQQGAHSKAWQVVKD